MDFPLYFQKVMWLWQRSIVEIAYGFFRVFGPYFMGKSLSTFKILIFGLWSFIPHHYCLPPGSPCMHVFFTSQGDIIKLRQESSSLSEAFLKTLLPIFILYHFHLNYTEPILELLLQL